MYARLTQIINKTGLHARPASDFVLKAKSFQSRVSVRRLDPEGPPVNAKSIVLLLAESISRGNCIEIMAEGVDEHEAVDSLVGLVESGFGELGGT